MVAFVRADSCRGERGADKRETYWHGSRGAYAGTRVALIASASWVLLLVGATQACRYGRPTPAFEPETWFPMASRTCGCAKPSSLTCVTNDLRRSCNVQCGMGALAGPGYPSVEIGLRLGPAAKSTTTRLCGYAGGCASRTRSGEARAGLIHSRTFTGTSGSYACAGLGTTCRGRRRRRRRWRRRDHAPRSARAGVPRPRRSTG